MTFETRNATITKTFLGMNERGFLDCWITVTYGGSGQGFGGWVLQMPKDWKHYSIQGFAGHHIFRILEIAGVEEWGQLVGKSVRVECNHSSIKSIGHIINDDWFTPSEDYKI